MKKIFALCWLIIAVIIFSAGNVSAKQEIIEASGTYFMDPRLDETAATATARAREEAKRTAVEMAGVYIQTYSKMVNLELDYDEVQTVTAQILKIQNETSNIEVTPDNLLKFTVSVKALVDTNDAEILKTLMHDRQSLQESTRQYRQLQKEYDDLKQQMENLRRQYDSSSDSQKSELKRAVAQNVQNFNATQELEAGNRFYLRGEYFNAIDAYNRAVAMNPNSAEIYNNRGLAYYHAGQLGNATEDFSRAVEINPTFFQSYNNRGIVRHAAGNFELAIADYTKALQINPGFANALNNRGNTFAAVGQYQNAVKDLQAASKLIADSAEIHNNLGSVYLSMKNYDAAIGECTQAIRLNQNFAEAYYNRALAYSYLGRYAEALPDAKRAMDLNPSDADSRNLYNQINSRQGK